MLENGNRAAVSLLRTPSTVSSISDACATGHARRLSLTLVAIGGSLLLLA